MEQGYFLKCQKCSHKPATIKLTNGVQDKKVCFQCERDLTREPAYKDWTKQFIPYSDLKQSTSSASDTRQVHTKQLSASKIDSATLRSPLTAGSKSTRNYLRRPGNESLVESIVLKSPTQVDSALSRNTHVLNTVSPRVGIGKKSYDITKPTVTIVEPEKGPSGLIRPNTPKKKVFYSEYLKDYDPKTSEFKSPGAKMVKREIMERTAKGFSSTSIVNSVPTTDAGRADRLRNTTTTENYRTTSHLETFESPRREKYHTDYSKEIRVSPKPQTETSHILHTETEKKVRDVRKDDIRNRLSKLSEQFYSPVKSPKKLNENGRAYNTEEAPASIDYRDSRSIRRDGPTTLLSDAGRSSYTKHSTDYETKPKVRFDEPVDDTRHKLTIQGYENNVASLKSHVESIEKRHSETINRLREELKQVKEELFRERTENTARNNKEIASLNAKVSELDRSLQEESGRAKLLEDKLEQNKTYYEKKLADTKEELEKTRREKDRRIEELNNQSKAQIKSNRDTIDQLQRDNEAFITRLRSEYELIVQDSNKQLEHKNKEIERLKEEKEDTIKSFNAKISTLQESVRYHQEINTKLRTNLELRNDEDIKVSQRLLGSRYSATKSERDSVTRDT